MSEIKVGDEVLVRKMPADSFYQKVIGTVTEVNGTRINVSATLVMSQWDDEFTEHPTSCSLSARLLNVSKI